VPRSGPAPRDAMHHRLVESYVRPHLPERRTGLLRLPGRPILPRRLRENLIALHLQGYQPSIRPPRGCARPECPLSIHPPKGYAMPEHLPSIPQRCVMLREHCATPRRCALLEQCAPPQHCALPEHYAPPQHYGLLDHRARHL
jgi:hypothetical protein